MEIRLAVEDDVPAILELVRRVVPRMRATGNLQWDDNYPNAEIFFRDIVLGQLWLAESHADDRPSILGVAAITTDQEPEYAQVGWDVNERAIVVHRLAVDPAAQGKGVASELMLQAEAVAAQRAIGVIRVDTNTRNAATQRLFPKLGYVPAGEISLSFRPALRFLCYEKRLPAAPRKA